MPLREQNGVETAPPRQGTAAIDEQRTLAQEPRISFTWKQVGWSLAIVLALGVCTYFVDRSFGRGANLHSYATAIESRLHAEELVAEAVVTDEAFLRQQVFGLSKLSTEDAIRHADRVLALSQERFNILLYEGDSLLFWTSNHAVLPQNLSPSRLPAEGLRRLGNGYYLVKRKRSELFEGRQFNAITLLPIRYEYALESAYLPDGFVDAPRIPSAVRLSEQPTAFRIESSTGTPIAYLARDREFTDRIFQLWMLGLHLGSMSLAALGLFWLASNVGSRLGRWYGAGVILGGALGLRLLVASVDFVKLYPDLGFLGQLFETPVVGGSLAGLLVNVVLAMWLVTFFHRTYRGVDIDHWSLLGQWAVTSLHYLAIVVGATVLTFSIERTIKSPGIEFDFSNMFNLSGISIVALLAMLTLMFAQFLLSHRLMLGISDIGLSKQARLTAILAALSVSAPILAVVGLPLPLPHFLLGCAVFMLVYDLFIDTGESNVLWLFFWLVVLSIYSAVLFFTFNEQKDLGKRLHYAEILSSPRDTLAETSLLRIDSALGRDVEVQQLVSATSPAKLEASGHATVLRLIVEEAYLYHNYQFGVFASPFVASGDTSARLGIRAEEEESLSARFASAQFITDNLRLEARPGYEPSYLLKVPSRLRDDLGFEAIIDFRVGPRKPSKFLSELLINEPYRGLTDLDDYNYAIYYDGSLVQGQGRSSAPNIRAANVPSPGSSRQITTSTYSELLYAGDSGIVVTVGKAMGGYLRPMSLFSYLFVWCIILTLLLSFLNAWIDVLPEAADISWVNKPDLKTKIQVGIIALVLLSFAMIGYVTVFYFHDSTDTFHDARLNQKVASILENVEHEIDLMAQHDPVELDDLARIVVPISQIHSMDVNLFDLKGDLAATSETEVFDRGVVAPKMGAYARQLLADRGIAVAQQFEAVGSLRYRTAYAPVRNIDGSTIGYLGLPYYSKQRDLRNDVSAFMGTLLNVYVFLLLIAGVIAISVANSITRPLTELGDKIRRFKVDDRIQPLEWKAHDELGDLIREFNTMLLTVEASAKELDNARRESAWREMAQQVAHEIKNPLTPMKLSIEFLRHAFAQNRSPAELEPMIRRMSETLIEQIDNLTSIASNFSTFARMPEPENSAFRLDQLVGSVYNLFLEEDVDFELDIAEGDYPVFADKKLVMRVLNNLLKNAIQAIPDGRRGKVSVSLQLEADRALVCVTDNGTGIPADMQEKVFFPKFTTKSSGSGLGLAICRDIIHAAQGRIYFETKADEGTSFFVSLPINADNPDPATPAPEASTASLGS